MLWAACLETVQDFWHFFFSTFTESLGINLVSLSGGKTKSKNTVDCSLSEISLSGSSKNADSLSEIRLVKSISLSGSSG